MLAYALEENLHAHFTASFKLHFGLDGLAKPFLPSQAANKAGASRVPGNRLAGLACLGAANE